MALLDSADELESGHPRAIALGHALARDAETSGVPVPPPWRAGLLPSLLPRPPYQASVSSLLPRLPRPRLPGVRDELKDVLHFLGAIGRDVLQNPVLWVVVMGRC